MTPSPAPGEANAASTSDPGTADIKLRVRHEKVPIPLLWLDTWIFIRLARARAGEISGSDAAKLTRLGELLIAMRDQRKLIVPETGHDIEIEAGGHLVEETRRVMTQVSLGVSTHFRVGRDSQIYRGLRAFAAREIEFDLPWREIFTEDPLEEIARAGPLIRVDLNTSAADLADHRRANEDLARRLEMLRLDCRARAETFDARLRVELRGVIDAVLQLARDLHGKVARGEPADPDEWIRYSVEVGRWVETLHEHLTAASTAGDDKFADLVRFYESPWWTELPAIRIMCELYAIKLTGGEPIRASDVQDMEQIAVLLPFAEAMVLDRAMADKVRRLRLDSRYGTEIIAGIDDLLVWLEALQP